MKKIITVAKNRNEIFKQQQLTIGVDLGDRISRYCIVDETGNVILEQSVPITSLGPPIRHRLPKPVVQQINDS